MFVKVEEKLGTNVVRQHIRWKDSYTPTPLVRPNSTVATSELHQASSAFHTYVFAAADAVNHTDQLTGCWNVANSCTASYLEAYFALRRKRHCFCWAS